MTMFQSLLHPRHVSLAHEPSPLHPLVASVVHHLDPYYDYNHMPIHRGVSLPRFNVIETETSYSLHGEIPGVEDRASINVVWLPDHTLVVRGAIDQTDVVVVVGGPKSNDSENEHEELPVTATEKTTGGIPIATFPRFLLHERHIGPFYRSFTFPDFIDENGMEATLKDGVLRIVVSKAIFAAPVGKRVYVQSSTG